MFIRSAAADRGLRQSQAIQSVNEKWGEGRWCGRETIGIQVCKKKYSPFSFTTTVVETTAKQPSSTSSSSSNKAASAAATTPKEGTTTCNRRRVVKVERMFGCPHHSKLRKRVIEQHGERPGWEPFGQWSMKKAQELARRETRRLNGELGVGRGGAGGDESTIVTMDGDEDEETSLVATTSSNSSSSALPSASGASAPVGCLPCSSSTPSSSSDEDFRSICHNGRCAWKLKSKYDNVHEEILEESSSSTNNHRMS